MLLGCVGNDEYGRRIKSELEKAGVKHVLETTEEYPSSRCGAAIFEKKDVLYLILWHQDILLNPL